MSIILYNISLELTSNIGNLQDAGKGSTNQIEIFEVSQRTGPSWNIFKESNERNNVAQNKEGKKQWINGCIIILAWKRWR